MLNIEYESNLLGLTSLTWQQNLLHYKFNTTPDASQMSIAQDCISHNGLFMHTSFLNTFTLLAAFCLVAPILVADQAPALMKRQQMEWVCPCKGDPQTAWCHNDTPD